LNHPSLQLAYCAAAGIFRQLPSFLELLVQPFGNAIQGFAKRAGFGIVEEFYDAAVSGADPIETRAGFAALLDLIEGDGVRTVVVEDASRFARELMANAH